MIISPLPTMPSHYLNIVTQLFFEQDIVFISMFSLSLITVLAASIIAANILFRKRGAK